MDARQFLNLALSLAAALVTLAVLSQIKPANTAGNTTVNHRATNRNAPPFHPIL